jgi:hypothetical protein
MTDDFYSIALKQSCALVQALMPRAFTLEGS